MKLVVAGSRHLTGHYDTVVRAILDAIRELETREISEIITGGATGIDEHGKRFAERFDIAHNEFLADWDKFGKRGGPIRNSQMASRGDALVLVWDGKSPGSASMKKEAEKAGIPIHEVIV